MKKHVIIFEVRGGSDKGPYGFRRDSKPIIDSLKKRGWTAEIIFYQDKDRGEIYRYTHEKADAYISRVNPGNLKDETGYFQMLRELVANGIEGLPHPDAMVTYGAKNSIERLKGTAIVPDDIYTYYSFDELKEHFPKSLKKGVQVLKKTVGRQGKASGVLNLKIQKNTKEQFPWMPN
jgi:glutathione synthase/RimK-type ligase-like ATP-grasp enzyme